MNKTIWTQGPRGDKTSLWSFAVGMGAGVETAVDTKLEGQYYLKYHCTVCCSIKNLELKTAPDQYGQSRLLTFGHIV